MWPLGLCASRLGVLLFIPSAGKVVHTPPRPLAAAPFSGLLGVLQLVTTHSWAVLELWSDCLRSSTQPCTVLVVGMQQRRSWQPTCRCEAPCTCVLCSFQAQQLPGSVSGAIRAKSCVHRALFAETMALQDERWPPLVSHVLWNMFRGVFSRPGGDLF